MDSEQRIAAVLQDAKNSAETLRLLANEKEVKDFPEVSFTSAGKASPKPDKADAAEAIASVCKAITSLSIKNADKEPLILNYFHVNQATETINRIKKNRRVNINSINSLLSLFKRLAKDMPNSDIFLKNHQSEIFGGLKGNFYSEKTTNICPPARKEHSL